MAGAADERAAKASSSGLVFQLHPLVLINISDHFVRVRAIKPGQPGWRVFGCLLGAQSGREVAISNSFELRVAPDGMDGPQIDEPFLVKKQEQYKQTFADLDVVGWYTTGSAIDPATDMALHRKITHLNESPVMLLMDTEARAGARELPVSLFESELRSGEGGAQQLTFVKADYSIQTSEAERIGVNQVARVVASKDDNATGQLSAHYGTLHSAIKMLHERIGSLLHILQQMADGSIPPDHRLLREASGLLRQLPAMDGAAFSGEYRTEFCDALLVTLMSAMTAGSNALLETVDKCNLAYARS